MPTRETTVCVSQVQVTSWVVDHNRAFRRETRFVPLALKGNFAQA